MDDCSQSWKPISHIFKRKYTGKMFSIITNDNRSISVTDRHPMIRMRGTSLETIEAKDIKIGDMLPIYFEDSSKDSDCKLSIDIINELPEEIASKTRVKSL